MPILASLALATFFILVSLTPTFAADPFALLVCVGPGGAIRAIALSESCPPNHAKVSVPIGAQPGVSFYTVARPVDTVGPLTGSSISVSCEEGDQIVSGGYVHGGGQPDLQISGSYPANERSWLVEIQNFSETLSRQVALFARCARLTP